MSHAASVWTYHWRNEWRRDLLGHQVLPVDRREEGMVLQFQLEARKQRLRSADWKQWSSADLSRSCDGSTYKVILHSQPLGAVLLQEPLQQLPACVWHIGLEYRRLVQDVVVHLSCVATVEWRLRRRKQAQLGKFIWSTAELQHAALKLQIVTHQSVEHLVEHWSQTPPVHCAVVRLLLEDLGGQILWRKQQKKSQRVSWWLHLSLSECLFVADNKVQRSALYLRCPAEGRCCTIIFQTFFAEAKICEDNVALRVQQDVLRLQVPVNTKRRQSLNYSSP